MDRDKYLAEVTGMDREALKAALNRASKERLGHGLPDDFDARLDVAYDRILAGGVPTTPGAELAVLASPERRAVASSCGHARLLRKLRCAGLEPLFGGHVYSADCVDQGKPSPDLFLLASSRLGIEPSECIVVEDSVNGVRAGVAAGMKVWGFTGGSHVDRGWSGRLEEAGASRVISDWAEGVPLLAALD